MAILVVSIAVIRHQDTKKLEEERVSFSLQLKIHHGGQVGAGTEEDATQECFFFMACSSSWLLHGLLSLF